jgi:hypothetical protein
VVDDPTEPLFEEQLIDEGRRLGETVRAALPSWVERVLRSYGRDLDDDEVAATVSEVVDRACSDLDRLLATDSDEQRTTPLQVVRSAMVPAGDLLADAGVEVPRRDPMEARIDPRDVYGLGPRTWADLGEEVAEAGLRWGAAKAFVHLRRHG